jgi:adenylate kinase family enzyme
MVLRSAAVMRVHIVGASGAGTTTLARALATRLGVPHFDTDDYFWLPSTPSFQHIRDRGDRQALLRADLTPHPGWALSGSLCGWGDPFIPLFDLVVFLWVPPDVRMARLRARERLRYGVAIDPGGPRHAASREFLAWAAGYDETLQVPARCRRLHEEWLAALPCPVVRFMDAASTDEHLERLRPYVEGRSRVGGPS